ncbi:MAG TPA: hypothetical protein VM261_04505 [Kofleriaceae bacterium]|nr:hypothetical protein [Kofleriaceae bacterium]
MAAVAVTLPSLYAAPVAHAATATVVNGNGAVVLFSQVSDDGCVVTSGQLVLLKNNAGNDRPEGVLAVATQVDTCDPEDFGNGFAGLAALPFTANGLSFAHTEGTVVLDGFNGGQLTIDLDLTWTGTGAVSTQRSSFHGENTFDFQSSASRAAVLSGSFDVDGEPADLSDALLIRGVAGSILR